ncbi:MAG: ABC transporter ATP-binding protein [Alphaproteobacteria bacterium 32-64-14]|nr:MAG: ABC transporter ATP-binding protein [Alphaproteobacteria bacterium 32-64-14]
MTAALETSGLGKSYGRGASAVSALGALDLSIPKGIVYGVLGPNGAGKSTLLRLALGLVKPSRGSVRLLGEQTIDARVLRRVGAMIEAPALYPFLTARETMHAFARYSGLNDPAREDAVLARVGLTGAADRKARTYSMGMRQRLALGAALLARPELLILDEPTNGLDPAGIQEMRTLIRELVDQEGVTIILSSHLLDEVQKVCDRVAFINRGQLVSEGKVSELVAGQGSLFIRATPLAKAMAVLGARGRVDGDGIIAAVAEEALPALIRDLVSAGIDVFEARWMTQSLERVFLSTMGGAQ